MGVSILVDLLMSKEPIAFRTRIQSALDMLQGGASKDAVKRLHGAVVLREALRLQADAYELVRRADKRGLPS
jgi:hypothetical protein